MHDLAHGGERVLLIERLYYGLVRLPWFSHLFNRLGLDLGSGLDWIRTCVPGWSHTICVCDIEVGSSGCFSPGRRPESRKTSGQEGVQYRYCLVRNVRSASSYRRSLLQPYCEPCEAFLVNLDQGLDLVWGLSRKPRKVDLSSFAHSQIYYQRPGGATARLSGRPSPLVRRKLAIRARSSRRARGGCRLRSSR